MEINKELLMKEEFESSFLEEKDLATLNQDLEVLGASPIKMHSLPKIDYFICK